MPARRLRDGPGDARVEPVVEADLDQAVVLLRALRDAVDIGDSDAGGLLDEDVRAGGERGARRLRQLAVDGGDDDHVEILGQQLLERGTGLSAVLGRQQGRPLGDDVVAGDELVGPERLGALLSDEAASDYADAKADCACRAHEVSLAKAPPYSKSKLSSSAFASDIACRVSSGCNEYTSRNPPPPAPTSLPPTPPLERAIE